MKHDLKCWPQYFEEILNGTKNFEIRKNDRAYQVGDILHLQEYDPTAVIMKDGHAVDRGAYSGRDCFRKVSYILYGPRFGLEEGYCIMSLKSMQ